MKKNLWLKIILSIIIMLSAVTAVILLLLPRREIYNYLYEQQKLELQIQISTFEAELNYDGLIQQIIGNQKITGLSTYDSGERLNQILIWLQQIYQISKWICGTGILLVVAGLLLLRNQKWYDVLKLGGIITMALSGCTALAVFLVRPLRLFILESQYGMLLGNDPVLLEIFPRDWGLYTCVAGLSGILLIGLSLLILYFVSRRSYKPHKF